MTKQERFERDLKTGKVSRDLWQYIPAKYTEYIVDAFVDFDGYFAFLTNGETVHAYTIADLIKGIKEKAPLR